MYFQGREETDKAVIVSLGTSDHDRMSKAAAKYLTSLGCDVVTLAPVLAGGKYDGWHRFPLESYEEIAGWLAKQGVQKIAVAGGSTTGMISLVAASYIPDISLALIFTGCDFLFEGFLMHQKKGKRVEVPAHGQSPLTWRGAEIPFSPYNLDDKTYHTMTYGSEKIYGELYSIPLFEHVEKQADFSRGLIPVENAQARIVMFGAKDDTLWTTTKYMERIEKRLQDKDYAYGFEKHIYEYGTHFVFPQGIMKGIIPCPGLIRFFVGKMFKSGKAHAKECEATREDIDRHVRSAISRW